MSSKQAASKEAGEALAIERESVRHLVEQILASEEFRRAPRQSQILRLLTDRWLAGQEAAVSEQELAQALYGRQEYNPTEESVVRAEVGNLRKRLDRYFAGEGKHHPVRVIVPRGHYRLEVVSRRWSSPLTAPPRPRLRVVMATTLLATAALVVGWMAGRAGAGGGRQSNPVLRAVFRPDGDTCVVLADSVWALLQDLLNWSGTLEDYERFRSGSLVLPVDRTPLSKELAVIATRTYTSFADAKAAALLLEAHPEARSVRLRMARELNLRDLRDDAVILLGSARSTPWVELFRDQLTFWVEYDVQTRLPRVVNRRPQAGELPVYLPTDSHGNRVTAYGVVALLHNLSGSGRVLWIAGTSSQATEAGVELVTDSERMSSMLSRLGAGEQELPDFELLYRADISRNLPRQAEILAWRGHSGQAPLIVQSKAGGAQQ